MAELPENPEVVQRTAWDYYIGHSKIQRVILIILHGREAWGKEVLNGALSLKAIRKLLFKNKRMTNSQRASFSRSIRRLEQEGLIDRVRSISTDGHTTHIGLTQRGYYQIEFEKSWYSFEENWKALSHWKVLSTKYGKKVNLIWRKS